MRAIKFILPFLFLNFLFCDFVFAQSGEIISASGGSGGVSGPVSATDNTIPRFNGTNGDTLQGSDVLLDDNGFFSWPDSGSSIPASSYNLGRTSSGQLNFNAPTGASHSFSFGGFVYMEISETDIDYLSADSYQLNFSESSNRFLISNYNAGSTALNFLMRHSTSSPEDDDQIGNFIFNFRNVSSATPIDFARIRGVARDVTAATEDGEIEFAAITNSTMTKYFGITNGVTTFEQGLRVKTQEITASSYNVDENDYWLGVTRTLVGASTINLPAATGQDGRIIVINDEGENAGANNITINASAGEEVNFNASLVLNLNGVCVTLVARNGDWYLQSQNKF